MEVRAMHDHRYSIATFEREVDESVVAVATRPARRM